MTATQGRVRRRDWRARNTQQAAERTSHPRRRCCRTLSSHFQPKFATFHGDQLFPIVPWQAKARPFRATNTRFCKQSESKASPSCDSRHTDVRSDSAVRGQPRAMVAPIRATLPAVHSVMQKQRASLASPVLSTVEMDYETDGAADDGFRCFEDSACSFGQQSNKAEPSVRLKGRLIDESLCQAAQDKPTTYLKTQRVLPRHAPTTFSASRMSVTSPLLDSTDPTDYVTSDANALHPLQRSCSQPSSSGTYSAPGKRHSSQRSALYSDCHSRSRDEATTGSSSFEQNCNCGSINVSTVHDEETSCMRAQLQDGTRYFPSSPIMSSPTFAQEWARSLHRIRRTLCAAPGDWTDPRTGRWATPSHLKAYVPLLVWLFVSVTMAVVVGVWHVQVFSGELVERPLSVYVF